MEHKVLDNLETYLTENGSVSVNDACDITIRVLSILEYCHNRNMPHNNITPAKIIVDQGKPTLIDYSLPINGNSGSKSRISNFLTLPELQINLDHSERNNSISDITASAGLLLYALTGQSPGNLKDEDGRMPHQRPEIRQKIEHNAGFRSFILNRIFDKAFQWQPSNRYQSSIELIHDLRKLKNYKPKVLPIKGLDEIVNEVRSNTQSQTITPVERCLQTALNGVRKICNVVINALEEDFRELEAGYRKELERPVYTSHLKLNYDLEEKNELLIEFRIEIVGSELVISGKAVSEGEENLEELYRIEYSGFVDSTEMEREVLDFLASNMSSLTGSPVS